jgi:hypothetical protein
MTSGALPLVKSDAAGVKAENISVEVLGGLQLTLEADVNSILVKSNSHGG